MPTASGGSGASEWVVGSLLTRGAGIAPGSAIAAAQTLSFDVDCAGDDQLDVYATMTGGAAGDLTVVVRPYRGANNATIQPGMLLQATRTNGPTLSAGSVSFEGQWDVSGVNKVRVDITNNNAGAQTVNEATWRLS